MTYIEQLQNIKEQISENKVSIGKLQKKNTELQNQKRLTPYYWVEQWINNNLLEYKDSYQDSISTGQYKSKKWLIDKLSLYNFNKKITVEIVGGWFGYPLLELISCLNIDYVDIYDIDTNCHKVLYQYINHFKPEFKINIYKDYFDRKELRRRDVIINTSSEHMEDISKMKSYYKNKPLLVIQSNNMIDVNDHINCVQSCEEIINNNQISNVLYKGSLDLQQYTRYMVIGEW